MLYIKEHPDFAGIWVATNGEIFSGRTAWGVRDWLRQMSPVTMKHTGYRRIGISVGGKLHFKYIHRLVMETWNPCDDPDKEVDHIDNNKLNNALSNLQWLTHAENMAKLAKAVVDETSGD